VLFDLFGECLAGVELVDDIEETHEFGAVAGEHLQLGHEVGALALSQERELVDVAAVAQLREPHRVLLKLEGFQQLEDGQVAHLHLALLARLEPLR